MWSPRSSSSPTQPSAEPSTNPSPARNGAALTASRQYNEGSTYIGKTLVIKGEMSGSEPIHIEGRIEGPISMRESHVNIGRDATVMSNVQAGDVIVRGVLQGNVTAVDLVEVHSGGSLTGNVAAGRVSVEIGAFCKGNIDMRRPDPKAHLDNSKATEKWSKEKEEEPALVTY
jgi:cytoskeletal protein CcmA (bactofilin family)